MSNIVVLFHGNCLDGTGAKYAAWKKFGDKAMYIPVQYGDIGIPSELAGTFGKEVYILDFSYPKDVLLKLKESHVVTVIDHHKTAEADLAGVPGCIFDMTKSGAVLAWEFFHSKKRVPDVLLHVQDRDLWKWEMFNTKEITTGLSTLKGDMTKWDETKPHVLFHIGKTLCEYIDDKVDSATKQDRVKFVSFGFNGQKYNIGVLNTTGYASEICQAVYTKYPVDFVISYYIEVTGEAVLSFRSNKDKENSVDVAAIAKAFGGGGHHNAAGGRTSLPILGNILNGTFRLG